MPDEKILKSLVKTSEKLFLLGEKLNKGEFGEGDKLFRGADIMVLMPGSPLVKQKDHWLDNDVRIITPYAKELTWLMLQLKNIFYAGKIIDWSNKEMFFGILGEAALKYFKAQSNDVGDVKGLLIAVFQESVIILNAMAQTFSNGDKN